MASLADRGAGRRARAVPGGRSRHGHLDLRVSAQRLDRGSPGSLETGTVNGARRITPVHQSLTFSRRMLLLGGGQAAVGALLIGRMGWLSVAENQKCQLLSESNRVQLIPVPPRRGWIIDRNGKPIAIF